MLHKARHTGLNFTSQVVATTSIIITTMIITISSITTIRCASSFTQKNIKLVKPLLVHGYNRKAFTSSIVASTSSTSGVFSSLLWNSARTSHVRTTMSLLPKDSSSSSTCGSGGSSSSSSNNNTKTMSLMMSSVAAISATGAMANTENSNNRNVTDCAESTTNNEKSLSFPDEALFHDTYNGVTIYIDKLSSEYTNPADNGQTFLSTLEKSLNIWKNSGKRGIWIHIPNEHSIVVPKCTELGFEFRHAKNGHLVMTRWLPQDQPSRLPLGPTHQLGVGIIIIHPITKKMLVVQEKTGPAAARKLWKMPTGLTDPGEDIVDAAIRETKEETGLECTFDKILCMRQAHGGTFSQSDLFIVCQLKLSSKYDEELKQTNDIELKPQEEEIAAIEWMDVDDFAGQELWQSSPLYKELNGCIHLAKESSSSSSSGSSSKTDEVDTKDNDDQSTNNNYGLIAKTLPLGYRSGEQTVYLSSSL